MKANSKKLLSLLMAVAMVLSMVPAISLQAEAAFDATNTICDACGVAPEGGWTEIAAGSAYVTLESGHYYLSGELKGTAATNLGMVNVAAGATVCLHSNGNTIRNSRTASASNGPKATAIRVSGTLNFFGTGAVRNAQTEEYPSVVVVSGGALNVYGGKFTNFDPSSYLASGYGATLNEGVWTVSQLTLPTECPCGATGLTAADWTELTSAGFGTSHTEHKHWYVNGALTVTGTANSLQTYADQCIYLMSGATLTNNGTVRARGGFDVHFFGEGSYVRANSAGTGVMFNSASSGNIYFHSGTYTNNADVTMFDGTRYVITGGTFNADPSEFVKAGYAATENNGVWTVAKATEPEPTEPEPTEPEPTEPETEPTEPEPSVPAGPELPTTCPACEKAVTEWKAVTAASGDNGWTADMSGHYYLANDITSGSKRAFSFPAGTEVCLHLNGHSITNTATTSGAIALRVYGTLRLMGEGTVSTGENTAAMSPIAMYDGANVAIYGGTYTSANGESAVRVANGTATCNAYAGTFSKISSTYVAEGYEATQNEDGTYTVAVKVGPTLPTECPCGATGLTAADWTELPAAGFGTNDTTHNHYYVAEDTTITGTANSLQTYADQCIYLVEGATLTNNGCLRLRSGFSVHVFGDGNYVHADSETTYSMFNSASSGYLYISGGNWTDNETNGVAPFDGTRYSITGGTFNFDPSAYVADGYRATEEDGIWTVAEYVAPPYPVNCPMCGAENVEWIEVSGPTGDNGFAASGHYILVDNIVGTAKRVFNVLADTEVCLYLNNWNITGTNATNAPVALQTLGTLRVGGEGTVSTPNVTDSGSGTSWGVITANGENAVVEIYGGTYIDGADRDQAVRSTGSLTVYGGTFSNDVKSFTAETKWTLPKDDMWDVVDLAAAAIITEDGYQTYATAAEAVNAYTGGYILMGSADSIELTKDAYVNNNGKKITVTGTGALKPVGETNGSWDLTNATVNRDATDPITGERFLTVGDQTYSFKMKVTKVVLRPGTTAETLGVYYKTEITIGDELVNLIDSYGVALSLVDMPTAEDILAVDGDALYTVVNNDLVAGPNVRNSGLLKNILKSDYTADDLEALGVSSAAEANTLRGSMPVYANAYIALDLDGDDEEEFIMADVEYNNIQHSLKSLMGKANDLAEIPNAAVECYKAWKALGMGDWGLTKLDAAAYPAE